MKEIIPTLHAPVMGSCDRDGLTRGDLPSFLWSHCSFFLLHQ